MQQGFFEKITSEQRTKLNNGGSHVDLCFMMQKKKKKSAVSLFGFPWK